MSKIDKAMEDIRIASTKCSDDCTTQIAKTHKIKNPKILSKDVVIIATKGSKNEK
jgi:hypothetical protein